ncbi:tetratricopeptide repeat protein [Marinoscillum sp.]|uniref:tetratricopeptide repeat protein n=1 Tax=Marinoscillum sp. TaxID=2024838 RepID=UPI003BA8E83E
MIFRPAIILLLVVLSFGCSDSKKYPIESARIDVNYYLQALSEVKTQIQANSKNTNLRKRKLLVSRELKWPEDVSEDIEFLKKEEGLSYELMQYAADFYRTYNYHEKLLGILEEWESLHQRLPESNRWKISSLFGLGRYDEAKYLLWDYVQENKDHLEAMIYAADNYLKLQDSVRAIYAYSRIADLRPEHPSLLKVYVPVLVKMGYPERASAVLSKQSFDSGSTDKKILIGEVYFQMGKISEAQELLRGDTSSSALNKRIDWYEQTLQWDSAMVYANELVWKDSANKSLLRKARLLENRGWLNSSYSLYGLVLNRDSTNAIAREGAQNVGRKIAYLRSLREAEEKIPVLEVSPKKATEDNE